MAGAGITVILTAYRRPHTLLPQVEAIRAQTVPGAEVWLWANEPTEPVVAAIQRVKADRWSRPR